MIFIDNASWTFPLEYMPQIEKACKILGETYVKSSEIHYEPYRLNTLVNDAGIYLHGESSLSKNANLFKNIAELEQLGIWDTMTLFNQALIQADVPEEDTEDETEDSGETDRNTDSDATDTSGSAIPSGNGEGA